MPLPNDEVLVRLRQEDLALRMQIRETVEEIAEGAELTPTSRRHLKRVVSILLERYDTLYDAVEGMASMDIPLALNGGKL